MGTYLGKRVVWLADMLWMRRFNRNLQVYEVWLWLFLWLEITIELIEGYVRILILSSK